MSANDEWYKSKFYYDLKDATNDVSLASGARETAASTARLAGKTLSNASIFTAKLGFKLIKEVPNIVAQNAERHLKANSDLPTEKRARMEDYIKKHKK